MQALDDRQAVAGHAHERSGVNGQNSRTLFHEFTESCSVLERR